MLYSDLGLIIFHTLKDLDDERVIVGPNQQRALVYKVRYSTKGRYIIYKKRRTYLS